MTEQVDDTVQEVGDAPDRWHPVYETVRDWLDAEAPMSGKQKQRNGSVKRRFVRR